MMLISAPNTTPPNRRNRTPSNPLRASSNSVVLSQTPSIPCTTKYVLCFLCLFDGLRTPSIRRLIRKPRTICSKPLLTFDPSFYAPSSENALPELYNSKMNCPCQITVDPSIVTVQQLLKEHGKSVSPQRLLLHYFGHGCHAPSTEGCLYFFNEDRTQPTPMKIVNILNVCSCPLAFIFDCPAASCLSVHLKSSRELFAFFACAADEELPLSTDAPMDLFSSCLLMPYDTALWWHMQRHSSVYGEPRMPPAENQVFLERFLSVVLDAIAFETQPADVYKNYTLDATLSTLFRGFALAQRVLLSFNLHASALPELRPMAAHALWDVWDIAIDIAIALDRAPTETMLYQLCVQTLDAFPSPGVYPIYTHFMIASEFGAEVAERLLRLLDGATNEANVAVRSSLRGVLAKLDAPSETQLLMIAKLQVGETAPELEPHVVAACAASKRRAALKCGMLIACLAIARGGGCAAFNSLRGACVENAVECAPFAALLLALLIEKNGKMVGQRGFTSRFVELCAAEREDVRATSVFLLGVSSEPAVVAVVEKMAGDREEVVREQVLWAMFNLVKNQVDKRGLAVIERFAHDESLVVKKAYEGAKLLAAQMKTGMLKDQQCANPILRNLVISVKTKGFVERYRTNIFASLPAE